MKFKSDEQRKAVFANMFNTKSSSKSRVSISNITNFEVKSTKMKQKRYPSFKREYVEFRDIKIKDQKISCSMCKRKGLSLKSGKCNECEIERKIFKQPPASTLLPQEREKVIEFLGGFQSWLEDRFNETAFEVTDSMGFYSPRTGELMKRNDNQRLKAGISALIDFSNDTRKVRDKVELGEKYKIFISKFERALTDEFVDGVKDVSFERIGKMADGNYKIRLDDGGEYI